MGQTLPVERSQNVEKYPARRQDGLMSIDVGGVGR